MSKRVRTSTVVKLVTGVFGIASAVVLCVAIIDYYVKSFNLRMSLVEVWESIVQAPIVYHAERAITSTSQSLQESGQILRNMGQIHLWFIAFSPFDLTCIRASRIMNSVEMEDWFSDHEHFNDIEVSASCTTCHDVCEFRNFPEGGVDSLFFFHVDRVCDCVDRLAVALDSFASPPPTSPTPSDDSANTAGTPWWKVFPWVRPVPPARDSTWVRNLLIMRGLTPSMYRRVLISAGRDAVVLDKHAVLDGIMLHARSPLPVVDYRAAERLASPTRSVPPASMEPSNPEFIAALRNSTLYHIPIHSFEAYPLPNTSTVEELIYANYMIDSVVFSTQRLASTHLIPDSMVERQKRRRRERRDIRMRRVEALQRGTGLLALWKAQASAMQDMGIPVAMVFNSTLSTAVANSNWAAPLTSALAAEFQSRWSRFASASLYATGMGPVPIIFGDNNEEELAQIESLEASSQDRLDERLIEDVLRETTTIDSKNPVFDGTAAKLLLVASGKPGSVTRQFRSWLATQALAGTLMIDAGKRFAASIMSRPALVGENQKTSVTGLNSIQSDHLTSRDRAPSHTSVGSAPDMPPRIKNSAMEATQTDAPPLPLAHRSRPHLAPLADLHILFRSPFSLEQTTLGRPEPNNIPTPPVKTYTDNIFSDPSATPPSQNPDLYINKLGRPPGQSPDSYDSPVAPPTSPQATAKNEHHIRTPRRPIVVGVHAECCAIYFGGLTAQEATEGCDFNYNHAHALNPSPQPFAPRMFVSAIDDVCPRNSAFVRRLVAYTESRYGPDTVQVVVLPNDMPQHLKSTRVQRIRELGHAEVIRSEIAMVDAAFAMQSHRKPRAGWWAFHLAVGVPTFLIAGGEKAVEQNALRWLDSVLQDGVQGVMTKRRTAGLLGKRYSMGVFFLELLGFVARAPSYVDMPLGTRGLGMDVRASSRGDIEGVADDGRREGRSTTPAPLWSEWTVEPSPVGGYEVGGSRNVTSGRVGMQRGRVKGQRGEGGRDAGRGGRGLVPANVTTIPGDGSKPTMYVGEGYFAYSWNHTHGNHTRHHGVVHNVTEGNHTRAYYHHGGPEVISASNHTDRHENMYFHNYTHPGNHTHQNLKNGNGTHDVRPRPKNRPSPTDALPAHNSTLLRDEL